MTTVRAWADVVLVVTTVFFIVVGVALVRDARRQGRITPHLGAFLGALAMSWLEPVLDWGLYLYYAPEWTYFPRDLPVVRLLAYLPVVCPLAYTWYFYGGAVLSERLVRRTTTRATASVPLLAYGFVIGVTFSVVIENFFITRVGLWTYTQVASPFALRAGTDTQWPFAMPLAMGLMTAVTAWLLGHRDEQGRHPVERAVARLAGRRRARAWHQVVGWALACNLAFGAITFGALVHRWVGAATTVGTVQPYPEGPPLYDGSITTCDDPGLDHEPMARAANGSASVDREARGC